MHYLQYNIPRVNFFWIPKYFYHMAESTSGEDQVNPVFWLASTWAGKGGPSCLEFLTLVLQAKL